MLVELFVITETDWTSERAIASLVAATNGCGIHALVAVIVPTVAENKLLRDFNPGEVAPTHYLYEVAWGIS